MEIISRLCEWYERQCADGWHEDHGVKIDTLDNPGWSMKIDLEGTPAMGKSFADLRIERSDRDWIAARKSGEVFEAFGGTANLEEIIEVFLNWVD